jgi:hypothetical protein
MSALILKIVLFLTVIINLALGVLLKINLLNTKLVSISRSNLIALLCICWNIYKKNFVLKKLPMDSAQYRRIEEIGIKRM